MKGLMMTACVQRSRPVLAAILVLGGLGATASAAPLVEALRTAGIRSGVVLWIAPPDSAALKDLAQTGDFVVQGVVRTAADAQRLRTGLRDLADSARGRVTVRTWDGRTLPYVDNLLDAVLKGASAEEAPEEEILRVLQPGGVLLTAAAGNRDWRVAGTKPWPPDIDQWTHYLHDADNNAVARDMVVGPPEHLQWSAGPKWSRHHDHVSSTTALVSANGRIFYIMDEGAIASLLWPSHWSLIARDAFNGKLLWKRRIPLWETRFWPLKSGPAQLPRRLVAVGDRVYVTLGVDAPVSVLDAATGRTLMEFPQTKGTEEILVSKGVVFALVAVKFDMAKYTKKSAVNRPWWNGDAYWITAIRADDGRILWRKKWPVMPLTPAVDGNNVYFHDGESVVCLDRATGERRWRSDPVPRVRRVMSFFAPTLVVRKGVVLFAGGEESGLVKSTGGCTKNDTLTALDAATGRVLWKGEHPPSGYSSPEDLFVIGDGVWCEGVSNGVLPGVVIGRELRSGKEIARFVSDAKVYWFHHRCYRGKATARYIMVSRTGIEFIDPVRKHWIPNHWIRGGCSYGIMPCNGLIYTPPHPCACYSETKLTSFNAVAAARPSDTNVYAGDESERLETFQDEPSAAGKSQKAENDWPMFRHDIARSGTARCTVPPTGLKTTWTTARIGTRLTQPVVVADRLFVADVDTHRVLCLSVSDGSVLWTFTAGGRVDSPPASAAGRVVFGSRDGYVYCLDARNGALLWRFRAAPSPAQVLVDDQFESVWPVPGSVLVLDGEIYAVAGRSVFLDGGLHWIRLDLQTGRKIREVVFDRKDPRTGRDLHTDVDWLNMPPGLPDVLSSDGKWLFMRSLRLDRDGKWYDYVPEKRRGMAGRFELAEDQNGPGRHLFAPDGFLDDSWFHRQYWMYGTRFVSGWCGYYLSGKVAPAGRIMCIDGRQAFGYGRKPRYYRWTTPMEYRLFAASLAPPAAEPRKPVGPSGVFVDNSKSLDFTGKAFTVAAWVKPEAKNGVVVARGGPINGFSLYLKKGRAHFSVYSGQKRYEIHGRKQIGKTWTHLAGVQTPSGELRLYVDGRLAARGKGRLIARTPIQAMQVGLDDQSSAGNYRSPFGLKGAVDEVCLYDRALNETDLRKLAAGNPGNLPEQGLVLHFTFDDGAARDLSGKGNNGRIRNADVVPGRIGKALAFKGTGAGAVSGYKVPVEWTVDVPILVRAMTLTRARQSAGERGVLFVAGPRDLVNEDALLARLRLGDPDAVKQVERQEAEFAGSHGSLLWAVSPADGKRLAEYRLPSVPVWDGMIAARGKLFLALADGRLVCMAPGKRP